MAKRRPRLIVLVARGTSDNAALFGRYLLEITTGIPVSLAAPSIATLYDARMDYREALVVAISQSGESTDTNLVLERARRAGRAHSRHHQRALQHAGAPGGARVPGARRQREERRRHQDLHRPVADALPAGVRAGRQASASATWSACPRRSKALCASSRQSRRSPNATASCVMPWWWDAG